MTVFAEGTSISAAKTWDSSAGLNTYTATLERLGAPVLGYLVLYSVCDTHVSRADLEHWFIQLGLNTEFLPAPIRAMDAYEQVTGKRGIRATYQLITGAQSGKTVAVTLMVRHVARDPEKVVRHLVREVRDEDATRLSYDTRLAEIVFWRDPAGIGRPGAGLLEIRPNNAAIGQLTKFEQAKVRQTLQELDAAYQDRCHFYGGDRLRDMIRTYVESSLNAVRVRPTGGVYFVHRTHEAPLAALRELVSRFGGDSRLIRIPLPDQEEMQEMVVAAITTKTKEQLEKLSADIAAARRGGATDKQVQELLRRFKALQQATDEHERLLSASLGDTQAALQLVRKQVNQLLTI